MRQAERLIALRALLARVEANARERRAELAAMGLGPDAPRFEVPQPTPAAAPAPPDTPPLRSPPARAGEQVAASRGHFDDDWSSLLTRDLNDPSPERHFPVPDAPALPSMPFSRVASFAPPPVPADLLPPPAAVTAPGPPSNARSDEDDQHPDSEIVRAIRLAAEHPHGQQIDPRDLWTGAASELRERRPATNPPVAPRPEDLETERDEEEPVLDLVRLTPMARVVAPIAPLLPHEEPAPSQSPAEHEASIADLPAIPIEPPRAIASPPPSPVVARGHRRRLERVVSPRKQSSKRFIAVLVVVAPLVGLATWSLLDEPQDVRRPAGRTGSSGSGLRPAGSVAPNLATAAPPSSPDLGEASPPPPTGASAVPGGPEGGPPKVIPPPPEVGNPRESGMLWVDAHPASAIYVQGVAAGDSGGWLEVACGMKNVRLARPGLPPPGHSFPMWLGVGQTVLIPCGGSHRVALRPD